MENKKNLTPIIVAVILIVAVAVVLGIGLISKNKNENINWANENNLTSELDVKLKGSNLTLKSGNSYTAEGVSGDVTYTNEDGIIEIKESGSILSETQNVIVNIPEKTKLRRANISTELGNVEIKDTLKAKKMKLEIGAGQANIADINTFDAIINVGAGKLKLDSGTITDLTFKLGIGEADITAKLLGLSEITTGIGNLKLHLEGSIEDYKIEILKSTGEVFVSDKKCSKDEVIGSGENVIEIYGGAGEIKIDFTADND